MNPRILDWYLYLYSIYQRIREWIFSWIGPIYFIYHYQNKRLKNITHLFYLNKLISVSPAEGKHYVHIVHDNNVYPLIFDGDTHQIDHQIYPLLESVEFPNRKNITFLDENKNPLEVDLHHLDCYYGVISKIEHLKCLKNLKEILEILSIPSTFVEVIELRPYRKEVVEITDNLLIDYLYKN